jgi:hypothetical protein
MHDRSSRIAGPVLVGLAAVVASAWPARAQAEQFVLVDDTFTYTKAEADRTQSHHFVKTVMQPSANWTTPIDYRNGSVHIRTEVIDKAPGGEITQWSICYFGNNGSSYGCSESGPYTDKGIVERDVLMTSWWQNETIDWTRGVKQMAFVMKDKNEADGHTHKRSDPEHFFPTTVRITMVQVSKGATYDASKVPGLSSGMAADAGASGAADAGHPSDTGASADVGSDPGDKGGSGGSGAGGKGGAGGSGGGSSTGGAGGRPGSGGSGGDSAAGGDTGSSDDEVTPSKPRKASSGCAVGGGDDCVPTALILLAIGLLGCVLRRAARTRA